MATLVQIKMAQSSANDDFVDVTLDAPVTPGNAVIALSGNGGARTTTGVAESDGTDALTRATGAAAADNTGLGTDGHYTLSAANAVQTWRATFSGGAGGYDKGIWVAEISGLGTASFDVAGKVDDGVGDGASADSGASVAAAVGGNGFAFGNIMTAGAISQNPKSGNAFTGGSGLINVNGNAACYLANPSGTVQPVWLDSDTLRHFCSSLVLLKGSAAADMPGNDEPWISNLLTPLPADVITVVFS